jgi:hypothetical protein
LRTCPNRANPSSANRARQFATDAGDTDNACAIAVLAAPSDAINNALARTTSRCLPDCDRATDSSNPRCPAEISAAATGFLMEKILSNQALSICETRHYVVSCMA